MLVLHLSAMKHLRIVDAVNILHETKNAFEILRRIRSVIKLDAFPTICLYIPSSIAPSLFFVLLLGKAFTSSDAEILVCTICIIVRSVGIRVKPWIDFHVRTDTLKARIILF